MTSVSNKKCTKELRDNDEDEEITTHKKRYVYPKESQQVIDKLRLVPKIFYKLMLTQQYVFRNHSLFYKI